VLEDALEGGEIRGHRRRVALELLIAHARLAPQCEDDLARLAVRDDAHRVVEDLAGRKRHLVVEHAEFVVRNEGEADPSHRRLDEPLIAHTLDGAPETRRPRDQMCWIRRELVGGFRGTVDPLADVPRLALEAHRSGGASSAIVGAPRSPRRGSASASFVSRRVTDAPTASKKASGGSRKLTASVR